MSKKQTDTDNPFDEALKELVESPRARARLPKNPTVAASLRKKLKLTQRAAAELLNVSKNTWIRWEKGQCKPDRLALDLLPFLAKNSSPEFCEHARRIRLDALNIAQHIRVCDRCLLAVKFIAVFGRL
jgi:DNA-binding transcriptional regulator YiaG